MPTYKVTDPSSGKTIKLTGDSPPTEDELTEIFGKIQGETLSATTAPVRQPEAPEWAGKSVGGIPVGSYAYGAVGAIKELSRFAGQTAGLVGGAMAGAPLGPAGAVVGAGLGYGMVRAGERFAEGEKATLIEAAKTTAGDVGVGALMEAGGQFAGALVKNVRNAFVKPIQTELPQYALEDIIAKGKEYGIVLSPAEVTGSKALALIESMFDKSPFSTAAINAWRQANQLKPMLALRERLLSEGGKGEQIEVLGQKIRDQVNTFLGQFKSLNEAQVNKLRDNILKKLGSSESYEQIGMSAQEAITARSKAFYEKANSLYDRLGELIPKESRVKISNLKELSKKMLEEEMQKPVAWRNTQLIKRLEGVGGPTTLEQEILQYPEAMQSQIREQIAAEGADKFSWKTIQSMRSDLGSWIADLDTAYKMKQPGVKFQSNAEAGAYKQLKGAIERDIESFAKESGEDIKAAFDLANAFYREGKLIYNAPAIKKILASNPGTLVEMVFRPGGREEIDIVTKAIGRDVFENTLKPAFTKKLLDTGAVFDPKALQANIKKYGSELLQKVYSPEELKTISGLSVDGKVMLEERLAGNTFIKALANEHPNVVVDSIIGSYERFPGSKIVMKNISLVKSLVTKETMNNLQYEFSDRLFKINQITGYVQPETLAKNIDKFDRVLTKLYSPEQVRWLKDVAGIAKNQFAAEQMARNLSGTAQNIIVWGQVGAVLGAVSGTVHSALGGDVGGTAWKALSIPAIILTPGMMTRIYLSPAGRKYFTLGMKESINSGRATEIATKIAEVAGINIKEYLVKSGNNKEAPNE